HYKENRRKMQTQIPAGTYDLYVEQEVDNVAVFHDVFLAFTANQALGLGGGHGAAGFHILKGNNFGTDKAPLEIAVDLTGGLGSLGAPLDGPGPAFVAAGGEEGDQAQQGIGAANQPVQAA